MSCLTDEEPSFLFSVAADIRCQVCTLNLSTFTVEQRQHHYEEHFEEDGITSIVAETSATKSSPSRFPFSRKGKAKAVDQDQFWYATQVAAPAPPNYSPGLVPVLKQALLKSAHAGHTTRAVLCHPSAVHIYRETWDSGWGCGYRNFLMGCASLMSQSERPEYKDLLTNPSHPGVSNLQQWIEDAWKDGYDEQGAADLKGRLVGTRKWIGTAELSVAYTSRRIPTQLVDFDFKHTTKEAGIRSMVDWVLKYFDEPESTAPTHANALDALRGAAPVTVTKKMPLVLQHNGHSQSIIGYEIGKHDTNLLVFDPSRQPGKNIRAMGSQSHTAQLASSAASPRGRRRSRSITVVDAPEPKRGKLTSVTDTDYCVIIDDPPPVLPKLQPTANAPIKAVDYADIVKFFRMKPNAIGKRKQYQILAFTMASPMSDAEQRRRRVVQSIKGC